MLGLILIGLILLCIILGQPLYVIVGLISGYCFKFFGEEEIRNIVSDIFYAGDKEILLAIPLFVLAGNLMTQGSISKRLIKLASALTAPIPSGMAIAAVLSCAVFAAISGSSPVTLIAVGTILYPALREKNYSKKLSVGMLSAGGTLGIIIPPSIPMIIFAIMAGVFVIETLSVAIQVISYKTRGKRVFLMAPIHHHYELKGWPEPKIIVRFWIVTLVLILIALATLKLR